MVYVALFVCFLTYSVIPATSMNCSVAGFKMAVAFKGMEKVSVILISFVELSYTYSSSASVAWQSLLTHIDIY